MTANDSPIVRAASPLAGAPIDGAATSSTAAPSRLHTRRMSAQSPLERSRDDWMAWRRTGITATDSSAVVGLSKWASAYSIWATKVGLVPDDADDPSAAMKFGKYMEPGLAAWFQDEHPGLYVVGEQMWCTHGADSWRLATVDGFVAESPDAELNSALLGGFEIKTTGDTVKDWDERIPDYVMAQVQWQMGVTGLERTWLATLHRGFRFDFKVRVIERDEADIDFLIGRARRLWFDHVVTGEHPEIDGSEATLDALCAAYPGDEQLDAIEADADLLAIRDRIIARKADLKAAELELGHDENVLRAALGDAVAITNGTDAKGKPIFVATWKPGQRTGFDTKALLADHPELSTYRTSTTTRTLLVKPPKKAA